MKSNKNAMIEKIKGFCWSCSGDEEPEKCNDINCPLYDYRIDVNLTVGSAKLSKSIENRCLECCGGDAREVLLCESHTCELWEWRRGSEDPDKKPKTITDKLFDTEEEIDPEDLLFG